MGKREKYNYMIKTLDKNFCGYGGFQYPQKKGALVEAPDWNPEPKCGGGVHGTVAWTKHHYIENKSIWVILKFVRNEAVIIDDEKIKVPRAWVIDWGTAKEMQRKWEKLTGAKYEFDYAIQTAGDESTQTAGDGSAQIAGDGSAQTAGDWSTQTAGSESTQTAGDKSTQTARGESTQTAGHKSTQTAGYKSTQTAGDGGTQTAGYNSTQTAGNESVQTAGDWSAQTAGNESVQTAGDWSTQTAGDESVQTAGDYSTQTAGHKSTQIAGDESTQTAGDGSVSIIHGQMGVCQHKGKVLQVLVFWNYGEYVFLTKIINDQKKHKLTAVEENGEWVLKDETIEESQNEEI